MTESEVARVFAEEWVRVVATLRQDLGDLDAAEDAAQEAFAEAVRSWAVHGVPERPGAWLTTTARRRAVDRLRREQRFAARMPALARSDTWEDPDPSRLVDDELALLFGCCHRSLAIEAQIALTLRAVAGLSTEQIARAFLVPPATMAARIGRAKRKIAAAGIPFSVPARDELADRLTAVLSVIYLVYTEGHASGTGEMLMRGDLCEEALWLAVTLTELVPDEPEVLGLAALLHLTDVRRPARVDQTGLPVLIEHQDRSRWDAELLTQGLALLTRARRTHRPGPYAVQAEIAALHGLAARWEDTDWDAIVDCYDQLLAMSATPVVALNRAVAVAMRDGPEAGLPLVEQLMADPVLSRYHYLHAARADLLRRLGRSGEAVTAYRQAISYCTNDAERRFLSSRVDLLDGAAEPVRTQPR